MLNYNLSNGEAEKVKKENVKDLWNFRKEKKDQLKEEGYVLVKEIIKTWILQKDLNKWIKEWKIKTKQFNNKLYVLQANILSLLSQ